MKKRILSIILAVTMVFLLLPTTALADVGDSYAISVDVQTNPEGGSVTVASTAIMDENVTFTVSMNPGYELDNLMVWWNGHGGRPTDNHDGTYSFTMPEDAVIIRVWFAYNQPHTHNDITFQQWESENTLPASSDLTDGAGNFYLTKDVTLNDTWKVPEGTVNLCLNGHVINLSDAVQGSVIIVGSGATLNLIDCAPNQTHSDVSLPNGGCITGGKGSFTNIFSYNSNNKEYWKVYGGAGVFVNGGTFNMNGGTISGNDAGKDDADTVDIDVRIFGSDVSCSYVGNYGWGGGVLVKSGTFNMSGGTIKSNNADENGGGLCVYGNVISTMSGGSISANTAGNLGGGVYVSDGSLIMSGNSVISGNTATKSGGGIYSLQIKSQG